MDVVAILRISRALDKNFISKNTKPFIAKF